MITIRSILRTMGEALTLADAGEMLTDTVKNDVLGRFQGSYPMAPDAVRSRVIIASDQEFTPGIVEHGIELRRENRAMLEQLCIYPGEAVRPVQLTATLPRLVSEAGLDFQVTRRQGELLSEVDTCLHLRRDTLIMLIQVGEDLRRRAERYCQKGRWSRSSNMPAISLYEEAPAT